MRVITPDPVDVDDEIVEVHPNPLFGTKMDKRIDTLAAFAME
jgi:hypothetical protein